MRYRAKVVLAVLVVGGGMLPAAGRPLADSVRRDHPRLFFNAETWPKIRERALCSGTSENRALQNLLAEVNAYPTNPVCRNTGPVFTPPSQPIPETVEFGREAATAALAWRFTGEACYLEQAKKMLRVSIAAYQEAYRNRRAVHWYSTRRILAICAYDWIYEGLTPDERREIIVPLVKHVEAIQPREGRPPIIRRDLGSYSAGFYGVYSLLWYSGLAALNDGFCDELAERHLEEGYGLCLKMVEYRNSISGDDGGLSSGVPDYSMGAYPWAHFNFMHTFLSATGENIAWRYPNMGLFVNWIWWNWIPTGSPSAPRCFGFGDDQHEQNLLDVSRLYEHMTQYMFFFSKADENSARLAATLRELAPNRALGQTWPMYDFILPSESTVRPFSVDELADAPLKARRFERLGQVVMRSGWRADSTYCLFTIGADGRTYGHKHWDEGNFVIYRNGYLALDSGSRGWETDTNLRYYYSQTVAHNCVLIHKPGEKMPEHWGLASSEPEAQINHGGQYPGSGVLTAFRTTPEVTYVASDLRKVYGEKCTEATRQFVHVQPNVFVVYDRIGAADPAYRKEWLLHVQNEPKVEGCAFVADCDKGRLYGRTLLPTDAKIVKVGGPGREFWASGKNWDLDANFVKSAYRKAKECGSGPYFGNWRLEVSPAESNLTDRFLHVLTAETTSANAGVACRSVRTEDWDVAFLEFPSGELEGVRGTMRVAVCFNRAGPVGAEIRMAVYGESGEKLREKQIHSLDGIDEQRGVMLAPQ